jgi:glycosyltransferase involved in cell wall biosynthesis
MVLSPGSTKNLNKADPVGSHSLIVHTLGLLPSRRTLREVANFNPDLAIVQFAVAALNVNLWSVISLCKGLRAEGVPVVVTFHEPAREYNLVGFVTRLIYRAMARVTDVPVVFSPAGRRALLDAGLFGDVVEVPHGTGGVTKITDEETANVRVLYGIHKPLVLTLGFTNFDKGADILLDAAQAIADIHNGNVQFLIAGTPRHRRGLFRIMERRDVKCQRRLVAQAKMIDNVEINFSDYVAYENMASLLHAADVVVLPYRRIAQSGIANLALSSQSVVVCSDLPGLRNDLGDAALYAAVDDSRALAVQISDLLGDGAASTRSRMRDRAGKLAADHTYARVAEEILAAGLARRGS